MLNFVTILLRSDIIVLKPVKYLIMLAVIVNLEKITLFQCLFIVQYNRLTIFQCLFIVQ
jgi:hypothetical protein